MEIDYGALKQALRIQPMNLQAWDAYVRHLLGQDNTGTCGGT